MGTGFIGFLVITIISGILAGIFYFVILLFLPFLFPTGTGNIILDLAPLLILWVISEALVFKLFFSGRSFN